MHTLRSILMICIVCPDSTSSVTPNERYSASHSIICRGYDTAKFLYFLWCSIHINAFDTTKVQIKSGRWYKSTDRFIFRRNLTTYIKWKTFSLYIIKVRGRVYNKQMILHSSYLTDRKYMPFIPPVKVQMCFFVIPFGQYFLNYLLRICCVIIVRPCNNNDYQCVNAYAKSIYLNIY